MWKDIGTDLQKVFFKDVNFTDQLLALFRPCYMIIIYFMRSTTCTYKYI